MRSSLTLCLAALLLAPLARSQTNPARGDLRIVILSDFNGPYGATSYSPTLTHVLRAITEVWRPDLLLSAGDVVAGQSAALPDERFAEMWRAFDASFAAPLRAAGIPYAVAMGNHDGSSLRRTDGSFAYARERAAARNYWSQPRYERNLAFHSREDAPFNYSFGFEGVFVVILDASSATLRSEQLEWLERELSSAVAKRARYRIVVGHLPLYPVSPDKAAPGEVMAEGGALRERLERLGADLYLSGHHAAYYPGKVGGLVLLASGGLGARKLLGSKAAPVSTVTLLDLGFEPFSLVLTTFDAETLLEVPISSLPKRLGGPESPVIRLDLAVR